MATESPGSGRVNWMPVLPRNQTLAAPAARTFVRTTRPRTRVKSRSYALVSCKITALSRTGERDNSGRLPQSVSETFLLAGSSATRNPGTATRRSREKTAASLPTRAKRWELPLLLTSPGDDRHLPASPRGSGLSGRSIGPAARASTERPASTAAIGSQVVRPAAQVRGAVVLWSLIGVLSRPGASPRTP